MKKLFIITLACIMIYSCGNQSSAPVTSDTTKATTTTADNAGSASANPSYDPERGEGKFTKVDIADKLDNSMAGLGIKVFELKCSGCHKLTEEKLVGPGWKGVTQRHKPEWIMNFVTNTDEMITKDPKAQAQLELCMVRMPNQNLSDEDARHVLEYMRQNDGVK